MFTRIKNDPQYENALLRVHQLLQSDLQYNAKGLEELEILSTMIKKYEQEHYPIPNPTLQKLLD
jgi:HTH-type transcriptional regulator/antitoxin HigA